MNRPRLAIALALTAVLSPGAACRKDTARASDPAPAAATAAPADLLLTASLPSLDGGLAGLAAYVNKIQPGLGAMIVGQGESAVAHAAGMTSLDGVDKAKALRLLMVAPKGKEPAPLLLVKVEDEAALRKAAGDQHIELRDGWALIGDSATAERIGSYALGSLAHAKAADAPTVTVHVPALLAAYRDQIEGAGQMMKATMAGQAAMAGILDAELRGVLAMLDATDEIELRLEVDAELASLDVAFTPIAGSTLATFVKAQKPSSHERLGRLPAMATAPSLIMSGHVELGPVRAQLVPWAAGMIAEFFGAPTDGSVRAAIDGWLDQFTGEMAMAGDMGASGMHFSQLTSATDGGKAMEAMRSLMRGMFGDKARTADVMGMKMTAQISDAGSHDGVAMLGYLAKVDMASLPPEIAAAQQRIYGDGMHMALAGWDDVVGMAMGPDSSEALATLIDVTRGKGAHMELPAGIAPLFAASKARGESVVYTMNLGGMMASMTGKAAVPSQSALAFSLGFADGRAHLRIALPAAHVLELRAAMGM